MINYVEKHYLLTVVFHLYFTNSNRHNQWAGLYGRVENDGFFSTTITNPGWLFNSKLEYKYEWKYGLKLKC